jgi:hypothetical protein
MERPLVFLHQKGQESTGFLALFTIPNRFLHSVEVPVNSFILEHPPKWKGYPVSGGPQSNRFRKQDNTMLEGLVLVE